MELGWRLAVLGRLRFHVVESDNWLRAAWVLLVRTILNRPPEQMQADLVARAIALSRSTPFGHHVGDRRPLGDFGNADLAPSGAEIAEHPFVLLLAGESAKSLSRLERLPA